VTEWKDGTVDRAAHRMVISIDDRSWKRWKLRIAKCTNCHWRRIGHWQKNCVSIDGALVHDGTAITTTTITTQLFQSLKISEVCSTNRKTLTTPQSLSLAFGNSPCQPQFQCRQGLCKAVFGAFQSQKSEVLHLEPGASYRFGASATRGT